jgi:ABC-2 type transport system ATP-binding protein
MLSRGYKQRVGLAQALIHEPEVLILDEPTTGLDPNQLVEIRELIRRYGKTKTVLLSTHIMQEVEAVCDRVIIINRGEIVADRSMKELLELTTEINKTDKSKTAEQLDLEKIFHILTLNKNK